MAQLVGSRCMFCQKTIGSIVEGEFCPTCSHSYHHKCRNAATIPSDATKCKRCGSDIAASLVARERQELKAAAAVQRAPARRINTAIFCLEAIALPLIGVAAWVFFAEPGRGLTRDVELYVSGSLLVVVILIEAVAFGLYKGHSWARLAAFVLLALSVLSICLPFAVVGLISLANEQAWQAYVRQRSGNGDAVRLDADNGTRLD
jgi:hypothetical protein